MMNISVIVPYFNNSSTIRRCLNSIFQQTLQCTEIILVDDGSNDSDLLVSILGEFNDSRIKYFRHEINKNGSVARNTGINSAQGEILALLDSDDEWMPNHLELNIQFFNRISPNRLFFFISSVEVKSNPYEKGVVKPEVESKRLMDISDEIFVSGKMLSCVTYVFPKSLCRVLNFDESLRRYQDIDFLLRASQLEDIEIYQIDNVGATVNWTNFDIKNSRSKGITFNFITSYFYTRSELFNKTSSRYFVMKEVLPICAEERMLFEFLKYFCHYKIYRVIKLGYIIRYFVKFIDGNSTFVTSIAKSLRNEILVLTDIVSRPKILGE